MSSIAETSTAQGSLKSASKRVVTAAVSDAVDQLVFFKTHVPESARFSPKAELMALHVVRFGSELIDSSLIQEASSVALFGREEGGISVIFQNFVNERRLDVELVDREDGVAIDAYYHSEDGSCEHVPVSGVPDLTRLLSRIAGLLYTPANTAASPAPARPRPIAGRTAA